MKLPSLIMKEEIDKTDAEIARLKKNRIKLNDFYKKALEMEQEEEEPVVKKAVENSVEKPKLSSKDLASNTEIIDYFRDNGQRTLAEMAQAFHPGIAGKDRSYALNIYNSRLHKFAENGRLKKIKLEDGKRVAFSYNSEDKISE